jgi:nifR3 family TIM-barrel protein
VVGTVLAMLPLRIGSFAPAAPVVLAPMAGVTNAAFRTMCRAEAPDLVYVNEMVMATAVAYGNDKTRRMMTFGPDERPRSLQIYGSDPDMLGRAVHQVCDAGQVDHVDLNFGCPAAKVTRRGGGAAVPAKPRLLRAIVRAAVRAAAPYGVPVTAKFRMGLWDHLRTDIDTGLICADEGVTWIALHARTVEQHYSGDARWAAIGELKHAVDGIPVLGNGDIWEAHDAIEMVHRTGCDGVVIGRGCLGRPWLFGDLVRAFRDEPAVPARPLGVVVTAMQRHARLLAEHYADHYADHGGERFAMRDFRKHTNWYVSGYPVGPDARRRLAQISSLVELDDIVGELDPTLQLVAGGERIKRGHTNGPIKVALPEHYLDDRDELTIPDDNDVMALSGG